MVHLGAASNWSLKKLQKPPNSKGKINCPVPFEL